LTSSITLKQISRLSGFSISTVSKALNNKFDISPKTRETIISIANKHNYVPNNYAVALRKKKTQTIAVIVPQINNSFYSCFIHHIEKVAYQYEYRIILFQSFAKEDKEKECLQKISDGSVDGVIILSKNQISRSTSSNYNALPIQYIQVVDELPQKELKSNCIQSFKYLLKQIN